MAEKIFLRLFWCFMLLTAGTALFSIWVPHTIDDRFIPTFFIPGFASFLLWAPRVVYRFLAK